MKTVIKFINKKQKMLDIIPVMQTNTIYNKGIPGIGATTMEINAERNSIIVLPFVPVIEGKKLDQDGHIRNDLIGVYDTVTKEKVAEYIEGRHNKKKKILCTPEKFDLVMNAIKNQGGNPYTDYFLLLDECETMIKDVDYRPKIKLPMKDFFLFNNKAMVSATPITPRDSRFEKHGFTYVKIRPDNRWKSYKKDIELIGTNNVISVLRSYINDHPDETLCVFTNCSKTINKAISDLKLENGAKIFCSQRLHVKRFKVTGIQQVHTSIKHCKGELAKVNFFTGRFFSAVDMIFPGIKPIIIMVTNIYHANHSKIDPSTDAIQISGRFRKGIKKMIHISNYNPDIPLKTPKELKAEIDDVITVYKYINDFKKRSVSNTNRVNLINQIFDEPPFVKFMTDGVLDTYMSDNIQHQQFVSSYYCNHLKLKAAYEGTRYFNVTETFIRLKISDEGIMRKDAIAGAERRKQIALMLNKFYIDNGPFTLDLSFYNELQEFRMMDEVVYTAYFELGLDFLETVKYNLKAIKTGLLNKHKERMKSSDIITEAVYIEFQEKETITSNEAKTRLQAIYNKYMASPVNALGTDIKQYFETTESHSIMRNGIAHRGYRLGQPKYPISEVLTNHNAHLNLI